MLIRTEAFRSAAAAPAAAFPQVLDFSAQPKAIDTTNNQVVNLPATVNAGDLLLIFFVHRSNGGPTITTPTGWTAIYINLINVGAGGSCLARVADGSEDGGTVTITYSQNRNSVAHVYRIGSWFGSLAGVEAAATHNAATTANPDSPSLTPSWGSAKTLWFTHAAAADDDATLESIPTNYGNETWTISGGRVLYENTNRACEQGTARREFENASDDPGAWAMSESENWVAQTVAIRPAA